MGTYLPVLAASKTLACLSAGLPDGYSSGQGRDSSTDLLQIDEMGGDMSIVALPPWPCYLPTESSQGSSDISWFKTVPFACESTQSKFRQRFYEGTSLSSIMPSVSRS